MIHAPREQQLSQRLRVLRRPWRGRVETEVMLADAVEAISKSIQDPTPVKFREIAREMIRKRIFDGQLDECQLTMADLYKIEESFEATLTNINHGRVEYPDMGTGKEDLDPDSSTGSGPEPEEELDAS